MDKPAARGFKLQVKMYPILEESLYEGGEFTARWASLFGLAY